MIGHIDKIASDYADRPAIVDGHSSYSYADLVHHSKRIGRALTVAGLAVGDRVAMYSHNDARVITCFGGVLYAGGVWAPVHPDYGVTANLTYLMQLRVTVLFYHGDYAKDVDYIRRHLTTNCRFICIDRRRADDLSLVNFEATADDSCTDTTLGLQRPNNHQTVAILQTGGTTGARRAVTWTWLAAQTVVSEEVKCVSDNITPSVCLVPTPLAHGTLALVAAILSIGGRVIIQKGFDAGNVLKAIDSYGVTHMSLPPMAVYAMLRHQDLSSADCSSLRYLAISRASVPPALIIRAVQAFGDCVCQIYGQNEVGMVTFLTQRAVSEAVQGLHVERLGSCGRPVNSVRVEVMSDDGRLLPPGAVGELVVQGPGMPLGYHGETSSPIDTHADRWRHTGDLGYMDARDFVYIVDRKRDIVVTAGFNVFSAEVEACLAEAAQVDECAVVGMADELLGEAVVAVVVVKKGCYPDEEFLIGHCHKRLGRVRSPRRVFFWEQLPKTSIGKINKTSIRARVARHGGRFRPGA